MVDALDVVVEHPAEGRVGLAQARLGVVVGEVGAVRRLAVGTVDENGRNDLRMRLSY